MTVPALHRRPVRPAVRPLRGDAQGGAATGRARREARGGERAGTVAGRFVLHDRVGDGASGSVWRAHDLRTGEEIAVKVLGQHGSARLQQFVREQAVRITHPHVVAPSAWAADDDAVVLSMELVRGGSVRDLLASHGALPPGVAARVLEQLLQGLAAVHAAGLVHRDVTPANLLLEATGDDPLHLRLGDFGLAAVVDDSRAGEPPTTTGVVGTDGYVAPEQVRGAAPDPAQDLWAVGRVGLELVTGLPPARQGGDQLEPRVPPHPLRPLLEALLDPDPARRPADADDALRRLRRLAVAPEPGPPVPDRLGPLTTEDRVDVAGWAAVAICATLTLACLTFVVLTLLAGA